MRVTRCVAFLSASLCAMSSGVDASMDHAPPPTRSRTVSEAEALALVRLAHADQLEAVGHAAVLEEPVDGPAGGVDRDAMGLEPERKLDGVAFRQTTLE